MSEREKIADRGEPLFSESRSVQSMGPDDRESFAHNIPSRAAELLELDDSSTVLIDIYQDGYVVRLDDE